MSSVAMAGTSVANGADLGMGSSSFGTASSSRIDSTKGYQLHDGPTPDLDAESGRRGDDALHQSDDRVNGKEKGGKKANPLADLIETEAAYVSELGKIIKKVAGAWSRSNFPPAELDTMFRNVESIYRINRSFLKSLKEIGPNPSSPRALGDLLMRWIDDMEAPYQRYCDNYYTDFDSWATVQSNSRLPGLLEAISETVQPDGTPVVYSDRKRRQGLVWTLDQLFALPQTRVKYYKKLYMRLLKSTQEGRSDHRLLVGANEKLDELLQRAKKRIAMSILDDQPFSNGGDGGDDRQSRGSSLGGDTTNNTADSVPGQHRASSSTSVSAPDGSLRSTQLMKDDSKPSFSAVVYPQDGPPPSPIVPQPLSTSASRSNSMSVLTDLETRLDTSRTLDIFSMKPKKCQLRINPPGIPFQRELRKAADVVIYFTPTSTGEEIVLRRAHLFLLTDLFLVCERLSPAERAQRPENDPADMWLLYPPLAGKHLRILDNPAQPNSFSLVILKKEKLLVLTESREAKDDWVQRLEECQRFGANLGLKVKTDAPLPSNPSNAQLSPGMASSAAQAGTPGLSPAISVTPSSRVEPDLQVGNDDNNEMVRDIAKVFDETFSPHGSVSASSLNRGNSFNSFVAPLKDEGFSHGQQQPAMPPTSSPALSPVYARSPDPNHGPSPPPTMSSPPPLQPGSVLSPTFSAMGSPPNALVPQQSIGRPQIRPGSMPGPGPGQGIAQMRPLPPHPNRGSPPSLPHAPPPSHLVNHASSMIQSGRPPYSRPVPHHMGSMQNGRPPFHPAAMGPGPGGPPRPYMQQQQRPFMPNGPSNGSQSGMNRPPGQYPNARPSQAVTRRPSAPDMRDNEKPTMRRSSEGQQAPLRSRSASSSASGPPKLPSDFLKQSNSRPTESYSPPSSPTRKTGPSTSTIAAQMRCRLYLKQNHAQWKALGNARLKLYHLLPDDVKQLVVENDKKPAPLISSIILPDGVERVGKVGVAVELSDNGSRTGIVYMLHLRSEESALALFGQLLEGSDRTALETERGAL